MDLSRRLSLRQLNVVVAVEQHHSLVQAAQHLGLTQPTVTKALQETEAILGVPLFNRTNRGVEPTSYGSALARHARVVIAEMRNAEDELADLRDGTGGRVAVGTMIAASARLLPEAIVRLKLERPHVVVVVREGDNDILMPALRRGELDIVVGRLPQFSDREGVVQEALYDEIACLVVRPDHPLAGQSSISPADLEDCGWILPTPQTTLRRQLDKFFYDNCLKVPARLVESVSAAVNLHLLLNADVIAAMPYQSVRGLSLSGQLKLLPIALPATLGPVGVSRRSDADLSPVCEALMTQMRAVAETLHEEEGEWRGALNV